MKYVGTDENIKALKPEKVDTQRYIHSHQQFTYTTIALVDREPACLFYVHNNFYNHKYFNYGTAYQN